MRTIFVFPATTIAVVLTLAVTTAHAELELIDVAADAEVREVFDTNVDPPNATNTRYDVDGDDDDINSRFAAADPGDPLSDSDNDIIALRFDTSAADLSSKPGAYLQINLARSSSNNGKDQRLWGVNSGAANLNTWEDLDTTDYGDIPGMLKDFDRSTQGVDDATTTFLGTFNVLEFFGSDPGANNFFHLTQAMLDNSGPAEAAEGTLISYLQSLAPGDHANFLIGGVDSTGTFRINTREHVLDPFNPLTGLEGANLVLTPEPSTVALLGLSGVALTVRRRRR
ncbi:PEP-CTERM sorting domain-containing protein [Pseudobythopirellula maris]|nr:PEP-CTERM sorting domain-containing protein [Pseudobythopirellula maris]